MRVRTKLSVEFVPGAELDLGPSTIAHIMAELGDAAIEAVDARDGDELRGLMLVADLLRGGGPPLGAPGVNKVAIGPGRLAWQVVPIKAVK
jgi:hypothetical protein